MATSLPGGLIQHSFNLVYLISTKVDNSEMNPAVLLNAHFSKPKRQTNNYLEHISMRHQLSDNDY